MRRRSHSYALVARATASIAVPRTLPSSPISEFGRSAHPAIDGLSFRAERNRNVAFDQIAAPFVQRRTSAPHHRHDGCTADAPIEPDFRVRARRTRAPSICGRFAPIVLAPSRNATPRHPSGARKRTADGSAHTAHRCAFSALQRLAGSSLIALPTADCATLAEHTKLNKERGAIFQQRCSGRIGPHHGSEHGAVTAVTSSREPVQEFRMFVRAIAV